jgi:hypothetical protein
MISTREYDEPVEAAVAAAKPREPASEPSALKKVPELLLDTSRQAVPVTETRDLLAKGLEMIAHDLVEHTSGGIPRFVARREPDHQVS